MSQHDFKIVENTNSAPGRTLDLNVRKNNWCQEYTDALTSDLAADVQMDYSGEFL